MNQEDDITGEIKNEINAVKKIGGKIAHTKDITFSSSNIINKFGLAYSSKQKSSISKIKKKYSFTEIRRLIEDFQNH